MEEKERLVRCEHTLSLALISVKEADIASDGGVVDAVSDSFSDSALPFSSSASSLLCSFSLLFPVFCFGCMSNADTNSVDGCVFECEQSCLMPGKCAIVCCDGRCTAGSPAAKWCVDDCDLLRVESEITFRLHSLTAASMRRRSPRRVPPSLPQRERAATVEKKREGGVAEQKVRVSIHPQRCRLAAY